MILNVIFNTLTHLNPSFIILLKQVIKKYSMDYKKSQALYRFFLQEKRRNFPIGQIFSIKPRRRKQDLKFKGVNQYVGKNIAEEASLELGPSQRFCNSRIKDSCLISSPRHFESLYTSPSIRSTEG